MNLAINTHCPDELDNSQPRHVGGHLEISENDVLADPWPGQLHQCWARWTSSEAALTDLDGLASLTSVGDFLQIEDNYALTNLDGLANIASIGSALIIKRNYSATCEGVALLLGWPSGPPDDTVGSYINIRDNGPACGSVEQILASVSGPTEPVINQAATASNSISLAFTPSTATTTAFPIASYEATCASAPADLSEAPASALIDNVPVSRTLTASSGSVSDVAIDINITHDRPEHLYITLTTPQGNELILWDRAGAGTKDIEGTFPTTLTPVDALSGIAGQTTEGDWVLYVEDVVAGPLVKEGVLNSWGLRIAEELVGEGPSSPIDVVGATRGRDYTCTVAPVSQLGKRRYPILTQCQCLLNSPQFQPSHRRITRTGRSSSLSPLAITAAQTSLDMRQPAQTAPTPTQGQAFHLQSRSLG